MGTHKPAGFTIIETMLFIGVSSALVVLLIASTGGSVNVQRYKDAAETFKSVLQRQYSDISSVQNGRDNDWSCGSSASPTTTGTVKDDRGQSDCYLMGKYVRLEDEKVSIYWVVGYQNATTARANDIVSLKENYVLNVARSDVEVLVQEWETKIAYPKTEDGRAFALPANPRKLGILIVRSPDSGQIYTFTNDRENVPDDAGLNTANLERMIVAGSGGQGERLICINSNGLLANNDRAVHLSAYASGSGAVELQTNTYLQSSGSRFRC